MAKIIRKHKCYSHALYHSDITQLENYANQIISELPTLLSQVVKKLTATEIKELQETPQGEGKKEAEFALDAIVQDENNDDDDDDDGLKSVYYPKNLVNQFAEIAEPNTKKHIETCGILCGKLQANKYFVTNILIPEQKGTSDSCTTLDYESISNYVMNNNLIVLGWIHTHPEYVFYNIL